MPELTRWLLTEGRTHLTVPSLLDAFVPQLQRQVPVDRLWVGTSVLHPQAAAYAWTWLPSGVCAAELSHERFATLGTQDNPMRRLQSGMPVVRVHKDDPDADAMFDTERLFQEGYTEFYARSLRLRGVWSGGFTWTTRRPQGFSSDHLEVLDATIPALSAVIEPLVRDSMYTTLLCTYLGADAGKRVAAGQVRRGDGQVLRAAVLFSDVRGFTVLSQQLPSEALLSLLGDVLEASVDAVHAHGGQVLKFLGDGLLAVFIEDETHDTASVCTAATEAAQAMQHRLAALRMRRQGEGLPVAHAGIGLHHGDLTYGNIGGPDRLDFTVIGPSVNLAARVESACSRLVVPILATAAVAAHVEGWTEVGTIPMKGIDAPVMVFQRSARG